MPNLAESPNTPQRKRRSSSIITLNNTNIGAHLSPSASGPAGATVTPAIRDSGAVTSYHSPSNPYSNRWRLDSPCASPLAHAQVKQYGQEKDGTPRRRNAHGHGHKRSSTLSSFVESTLRDVRWATSSTIGNKARFKAPSLGGWRESLRFGMRARPNVDDVSIGKTGDRDLWELSGRIWDVLVIIAFWTAVVVFFSALLGIGASPNEMAMRDDFGNATSSLSGYSTSHPSPLSVAPLRV